MCTRSHAPHAGGLKSSIASRFRGRLPATRWFPLLEGTPAIPVPFVVLDLLSTFYDESVQIGERKQLLRACILQLERLARVAGGIVSIHPPAVSSPVTVQLLEMLQTPTMETYFIQTATPPPAQERLL
jgi:hypothetical protein